MNLENLAQPNSVKRDAAPEKPVCSQVHYRVNAVTCRRVAMARSDQAGRVTLIAVGKESCGIPRLMIVVASSSCRDTEWQTLLHRPFSGTQAIDTSDGRQDPFTIF